MARRSTTPTSAESSIISPRPISTSPGCLALDVTIQCTPSAGCRDRRAIPAGIAASTAGSAAVGSVHVSGRSRKVYWGRHRVCTTIPARHGLDSSDAFLEPTLRNSSRNIKRVWQLYVAYVVLPAIYTVTIGDVAARYAAPDIIYEFNVAGLVDHPIRTVGHGLLLQTRALNLDVLPLYIVLMATLLPVLWMMLRKPDLTMAGSLALYLAARQFEWNLPSFPDGSWYFNPFCWQLLFVFGAWLALGGASERRSIQKSRIALCFGIAYLAFALAMTMAGRFPAFGT